MGPSLLTLCTHLHTPLSTAQHAFHFSIPLSLEHCGTHWFFFWAVNLLPFCQHTLCTHCWPLSSFLYRWNVPSFGDLPRLWRIHLPTTRRNNAWNYRHSVRSCSLPVFRLSFSMVMADGRCGRHSMNSCWCQHKLHTRLLLPIPSPTGEPTPNYHHGCEPHGWLLRVVLHTHCRSTTTAGTPTSTRLPPTL